MADTARDLNKFSYIRLQVSLNTEIFSDDEKQANVCKRNQHLKHLILCHLMFLTLYKKIKICSVKL